MKGQGEVGRGLWLKGNTGRGQKPEKARQEARVQTAANKGKTRGYASLEKGGLVCSRKTLDFILLW